jgi:hypothetical protein
MYVSCGCPLHTWCDVLRGPSFFLQSGLCRTPRRLCSRRGIPGFQFGSLTWARWGTQAPERLEESICETAKLISFWRNTRMRLYRGARREAIEWIDYRRIHDIAASGFHPFSRADVFICGVSNSTHRAWFSHSLYILIPKKIKPSLRFELNVIRLNGHWRLSWSNCRGELPMWKYSGVMLLQLC